MFKAAKLSLEGENEKALKILLEIARREPRNFYAHNNVGMVYVELKEYDKALEAYEKKSGAQPDISNGAQQYWSPGDDTGPL